MRTILQSEVVSGSMGQAESEREVGRKMVEVSVEVRSGTARFRVGVQAQSISKALSMVGGRYPHGEVGVLFPIEPEGFFVRDSAAPAGMVGTERTHKEAA